MADPLTPDDVEHEDDRDRREREQEERLERERYGPACPHPKACWGEGVCLSVEGGGPLCRDEDRDPTHTHCSMCGKPLEATLTCVACGDADFRIRPDAAEGIAGVFGGTDEGWGRRAEDQAA